MKMQTRKLANRLYYTRKIELHRKAKKSHTVRITPIVICPSGSEISVLIMVRRVHYSKMGKVPTTVRQPVLEKENSEFKPAVFTLKINFVPHPAHGGGVG